MQWFGIDDQGQRKLFGLPVSNVWTGEADALLDGFEPENPSLFIPRTYGLGWSLNVGALAVKAGWIRPDDSLPDLAEHIPTSLARGLRAAPLVGGIMIAGMAWLVARQDQVATKWSLAGRPVNYSSGTKAILAPLIIPATVFGFPKLVAHKTVESPAAINLATSADVLGAEAMALVMLLASYRSASNKERRQPLAVAGVALWPVVTGALQIACVKAALANIRAGFSSSSIQQERDNS